MRNRCQRNNNPVNLMYAKQKEASGEDMDGFAVFPTPEAGWRAAHHQIDLDRSRWLTLKEFIYKFAPPKDNDTDAYLAFVVGELGLDENHLLSDISKYALAGVMACMEGYYTSSK